MDFTKFHCPVCNKNFTENDDVVVCPECGTPHHRECYKITGKCFNEGLHGSENNLKENYKNPEEEKKTEIFKPTEENSDENKKENSEKTFNINYHLVFCIYYYFVLLSWTDKYNSSN